MPDPVGLSQQEIDRGVILLLSRLHSKTAAVSMTAAVLQHKKYTKSKKMNELYEMSLQELWQLFPIALVPHQKKWAEDYAEMEAFLKRILAGCSEVRIDHIGSTAIQNICAKNIVDILVQAGDIKETANIIQSNGFLCMAASPDRIDLNRGYTPAGYAEKVFHLHIRRIGDNDELYFRDYLNDCPAAAGQYERLKQELCEKYRYDRDAYTQGKAAFVTRYTAKARSVYGKRYG